MVVRPPAVYGPRDREALEFFRIAARGLRPRMAGRDLRLSLVHVEDLARGLVAAVESPGAPGGPFHLCHPEVRTLGEVLDRMAAALGNAGRALPIPRGLLRGAAFLSEHAASITGRVPDLAVDKARELVQRAWVADPSAAGRVLGWRARTATEAGIPATAGWYRAAGWL